MKAPDKIYLHEEDFARIYTQPSCIIDDDIAYIRKEALLEFVNKQLQESADRLDFHANKAYAEVLDKLNEM